ncbi:restriction endonuclease subunit S [Acinetobacter baumannii]|nr:restriction endonuclease subunit S [Acinetobacter baumannii]MDV7454587.1 restriction endonuclease subunit S [Acinetobacter baumannii]
MTFPLRKFTDIVQDKSGGNKKLPQEFFLIDGRYPVIDQSKKFIAGYINDQEYLLKSTDLPVVIFGDHTKAIKFVDFPFAMGADGVKVLKPKDECDTKYLYHYLRYAKIPDAGYSRHYKFLKELEIPLPPLAEQRRIAAILDKADELRQKRQQVIEKLDQLLQATFIDMFGDPVSNPKGWQRIPSKNVLKIQGGYAFSSKDFSDTGIPVVKIGNANKLGFNTEKFDFITPKYPEKLTQYELKSGDLLMSLTGTVGKDDYGNITEVTDDYDLYYLNQRVAKLEVINPLFSKNYIRYFFSQSSIKGLITKNNRGVRQANISNTDIYELDILLPTRELLDKFDLCIKSINKMKRTFQMQLSSSNRLFNSLQNQAFSGTL